MKFLSDAFYMITHSLLTPVEDPNKTQQFNGDRNDAGFIKGVKLDGSLFSSFVNGTTDTDQGSYFGEVGNIIITTDICVASNGAVVIMINESSSVTLGYSILQGDGASVQSGFEYPNVFKALRDDNGIDTTSEYYFYNNGGVYPWFSGKPLP